MYTGGDTAPVILYRNAVSGVYRYLYQVAVTGKRLVYRVIHYFIDKMVQSAHRSCSDVHSGALADSLKSLKHLYLAFGVCLVRYNGIKHLILRVKRRFCGFNVELSHVFRNLCGFCCLIGGIYVGGVDDTVRVVFGLVVHFGLIVLSVYLMPLWRFLLFCSGHLPDKRPAFAAYTPSLSSVRFFSDAAASCEKHIRVDALRLTGSLTR